jgi:pyruvate dehydrogenase E2 component (dihydrolipoamide acetyltransferase)
MAKEVILPKLGQTMEEGTIVEWVKNEGDPVNRGDILFQVETDKAVLDVEARSKGTLRKVLVEPGVKVPVLTVVGIIGDPDEDISDLLAGTKSTAEPPTPEAVVAEAREEPVAAPSQPESGRLIASPRARKLAREKGVDLSLVSGTGPHGRRIERDVLDYMAAQPTATPLAQKLAREAQMPLAGIPSAGARLTAASVRRAAASTTAQAPISARPEPGEVTPMSGLRAIVAERMAASAHTTAAVTLQNTVDVTEFVALRTKLKETFADELGFSVSYNDVLAFIVARCLVEMPYMNVRLEESGIRQLHGASIGIAADSARGLIVPVIHGADKMGIKEIAIKSRGLVLRARECKSLPDELTGGTFTITNLGMFGVDTFTPIINLPECAILGVGRIRPEPTALDGEIVVRQRMWISLTFDHRVVDGAPAARFFQRLVAYIESPCLLLA